LCITAHIVRELEYFEKLDELFERAVLHQNGHHVIWVMMVASYDDDDDRDNDGRDNDSDDVMKLIVLNIIRSIDSSHLSHPSLTITLLPSLPPLPETGTISEGSPSMKGRPPVSSLNIVHPSDHQSTAVV